MASFEALEKQLHISRRTVRRALAKHGYYSSCNANGSFVTLRETPRFSPEGLWVYRQWCFSSHGSLLQTIVALVEASPAGKTLAELQEHLYTHVHNQVSGLLQEQKLTRVYSGRHVVYLACDAARAAAQQRQRQESVRPEDAGAARIATSATPCPEGMRAETVIRVLVQMIAMPKASPASLAKKLQAQDLAIQAEQVRRVIEFYALEKKNGTLRIPMLVRQLKLQPRMKEQRGGQIQWLRENDVRPGDLVLRDLLEGKPVPSPVPELLGRELLLAFHQWILDFARDGRRQGFPFDPNLLYLHRRVVQARAGLNRLCEPQAGRKMPQALSNLKRMLNDYLDNPRVVAALAQYEAAWAVFQSLRETCCGSRPKGPVLYAIPIV